MDIRGYPPNLRGFINETRDRDGAGTWGNFINGDGGGSSDTCPHGYPLSSLVGEGRCLTERSSGGSKVDGKIEDITKVNSLRGENDSKESCEEDSLAEASEAKKWDKDEEESLKPWNQRMSRTGE
ncbi:hypothetical protein PIB30_085208, partial [Stylosanthes scabra]|nr:hypothetical protein [Stylosanthes scabra]